MSSSQAQRQERLQARLRGAGTSAFSGAFTFGFNLPQDQSPPRGNAPAPELPPPPPPEPTKEPTQRTPPTRASPRLNSGLIETPIQRSTRSSSRLSSVSSQQQSVRSSGQKRKRTEITNDETPIPHKETSAVPTESQFHNLYSSIPATSAPRHTESVTPQTRGQRKRQPSPDKFLTPGDGVATRLFGMDSGARSDRFDSPVQENIFKALVDEGGANADEMLLDTKSLLEDILGPATEEASEHGNDTVMENAWEQMQEEEEEADEDGGRGDEGDEQEVEVDGVEEKEQELERKPRRFTTEVSREPEEAGEQELEEQEEEEEENEQEVEEEEEEEENEQEVEEGEEEEAEASEEDEDLPEVDDTVSDPTPKPARQSKSSNIQKPPQPPRPHPQPQKSKPKLKSKLKPDPRKTIEITVHRLSKSKTKQIAIPAINPLDVLSQVFKEMLKKQYGKLDSSVGRLALEVFADEIEVRLLEHIDTLNTTLQTAKEARKYYKMRQDKREELMALRQELGKVELEIDEVRRKHERESRESKTKHLITERLENISAAQELCRAHSAANLSHSQPTHPPKLDGGIDLLLARLTGQVTSTRRRKRVMRGGQEFDHLDDEALDEDEENLDEIFDEEMGAGGDGLETGSILERVRGFNRFLERAEKVVREANARRLDGRG